MNFRRKQKPEAFNPEAFDVNTIEDEIGELIATRPILPYAHAQANVPPPETTVEQIGTVTAEAVMAQYEAAAKTISDMKAPLAEWSSQCQTALADLKAAMEYIDETAKRFREIGQSTHDRIQKSSLAITEVRKTCDDIRMKIDPDA